MSENLDLVRSILAAWERGDFSSAEWADSEIEYEWVDGLSPGSWKGVAGMEEATRDLFTAWEGIRFEVDGDHEVDAERVLVLTRIRARGKASGLEIGDMGGKGANLFYLRGGKVTKIAAYFDRDRAFADLGLTPEGGAPAP
jgi:ketosteroid isomerase-like protein